MCSRIAISIQSGEDNMTSILTRKRRLPDGRIEREVLQTGFLRCLAEKTDARATFTAR